MVPRAMTARIPAQRLRCWTCCETAARTRPDADELARRLARRASPGDIIVMHDGHHIDPAADRRYAVEATRQLIVALKATGFTFSSLCTGTGYRPSA